MLICGTPSEAALERIQSDHARNYVRNMEARQRQDFRVVFRGCSDQAIDLLEKMLELDAEQVLLILNISKFRIIKNNLNLNVLFLKRITAEEALQHPYFEEYHDPDDEPTGKY